MVDVWLTKGLPASGKSTWAKQFAAETGAIRFNMDEARAMMGFPAGSGLWDKEKEFLAFAHMLRGIEGVVRSARAVIIDNTHLNRGWAIKYKQALQFDNVTWHLKDFSHVSLGECLKREALRMALPLGEGPKIIKGLHTTMIKAEAKGMGVTEEWLNEPLFKLKKYPGNPGKKRAVLVDLDGTLALMNGRSPYEFWQVDEDDVNHPVLATVRALRAQDIAVIGFSGRDEGLARVKTQHWFAKHAIILDGLFMREAGDHRRDDVVKHDLFWKHIADNYDVLFTLDDRNRVVDTWRAMGISCFQVAPGNF